MATPALSIVTFFLWLAGRSRRRGDRDSRAPIPVPHPAGPQGPPAKQANEAAAAATAAAQKAASDAAAAAQHAQHNPDDPNAAAAAADAAARHAAASSVAKQAQSDAANAAAQAAAAAPQGNAPLAYRVATRDTGVLGQLKLHAGPGTNYPQVGTLEHAALAIATGRTSAGAGSVKGWAEVNNPSGGRAWASLDYLTSNLATSAASAATMASSAASSVHGYAYTRREWPPRRRPVA